MSPCYFEQANSGCSEIVCGSDSVGCNNLIVFGVEIVFVYPLNFVFSPSPNAHVVPHHEARQFLAVN